MEGSRQENRGARKGVGIEREEERRCTNWRLHTLKAPEYSSSSRRQISHEFSCLHEKDVSIFPLFPVRLHFVFFVLLLLFYTFGSSLSRVSPRRTAVAWMITGLDRFAIFSFTYFILQFKKIGMKCIKNLKEKKSSKNRVRKGKDKRKRRK